MSRPSCLECVAKHVANAEILMQEYRTGYKVHRLMAIGELEQARQEAEREYPELAARLYAERKNIWNGDDSPDLYGYLVEVQTLLDQRAELEKPDEADTPLSRRRKFERTRRR